MNVPDATVKSLDSSRVAVEFGAPFVLTVDVVKRSWITSLAITATGATGDIDSRYEWRFTQNVKWNNDYSRLLIPANISSFQISIDAKIDSVEEKIEKVMLTVGGRPTEIFVLNRHFRAVSGVRYNGWEMNEGEPGREYFRIFFKNPKQLVTNISYFRLQFAGRAFTHFGMVYEAKTPDVFIRYIGNGFFSLVTNPGKVKKLSYIEIKAVAFSDTKYGGRQTGWLYAPGEARDDNNKFTVRDQLWDKFQSLETSVKTGFVREIREYQKK